jgi:rubrerythrin
MTQEQDATLAGLQTALQMEIDGKEFYLKASKASQNSLGKQLLKALAAEEDLHREVFKNIYNKIKNKKAWPELNFKPDHGQKLRTLFAEAIEKADKGFVSMPTEIDAVKTGMNMENKTLDFYRSRSSATKFVAEKQLYDSLAAQESEHFRVLQDYFEFLKDPAQWYVNAEHTSVDGG